MTQVQLDRQRARARAEERRRPSSRARRETAPSPSPSTPVAYPGPAGSHTAAAAAALFPSGPLLPLSGFRAVADAVAAGEAMHGVLPVESSLAGAVAETHDLLYERELSIVGETVLPIRHCLVGPAPVPLDEIHVVRSHPSALDQCRDLLARLPHASVVPVATTSDAARLSAQRDDPTEVAIAGRTAAELYGLTVLADDVGDHAAFTRFVAVAAHTRLDTPRESARIALSFVTAHRPGALHAAITPFAESGLDLQRLVSRPLPESPFAYRFDAVVAGHPLDPAVRQTLRDVQAVTRELRVLGVYEQYPAPGAGEAGTSALC